MRESAVLGLLRACPELSIDLAEAAIAQQTCSHLRARWREFVSFAVGDVQGPWPAWRRTLPDCVSDSFCAASDDARLLSREDLSSLTTTKLDNCSLVWFKQTSGTTGAPLSIPYSKEFHFEQRFLDIPRILFLRGVEKSQSDVLCVHVTDTATAMPVLYVSPLDPSEIYATLRIGDPNFRGQLAMMNPRAISSRPELLEIACRQGLLSGLDFDIVVSAGGYLSDDRRRLVKQATGVDCLNVYALSEVGVVASECALGNMHVHEDAVFVEMLCEESKLASEGEGELVVSSRANERLPLARYRTQDRGTLDRRPCSCGLAGAQLFVTEGRTVPLFHLDGISSWSPTCFNRLPFDVPIVEYQIRQVSHKKVEVAVQLDDLDRTPLTVLAAVQSYARARVPQGISVETVECRFDPARKHVRYVPL